MSPADFRALLSTATIGTLLAAVTFAGYVARVVGRWWE